MKKTSKKVTKKAAGKSKGRKSPAQRVKELVVSRERKNNHFRIAIFGSARTKKSDKLYKEVRDLAKKIGQNGWDIVTGGGEGLMGAANEGHALGDGKNRADSIGLPIWLPWENKPNKHIEIKKEFKSFGPRLATFMKLSDVAVMMPGGVGTCLELFYTWQLVQVGHKEPIPIILVGKMWKELIAWVEKYPLKDGWISPGDMDSIILARDANHAFKIIEQTHKELSKKSKK